MAFVDLSRRDIDYIGRVVATEVPSRLSRTNPQAYRDMVGAVVDTVTNRLSTGRYGSTIPGVLNERRAFSKITGPARLSPYGSVQRAPRAPSRVQAIVNEHIAHRIAGMPSKVPGALDYANPNYSDLSNLNSWVNPMISAGAVPFGQGTSVHYHGVAPGNTPAGPYGIRGPEDFMPKVDPSVQRFGPQPNPSPAPRDQLRPDNRAYQGPAGNFNVAMSAPVGPVQRGGSLPPARSAASLSPMRPDNVSYTGPQGSFNVNPTVSPSLASAPRTTSPNALADAYSQYGSTLDQVGVRLDGTPTRYTDPQVSVVNPNPVTPPTRVASIPPSAIRPTPPTSVVTPQQSIPTIAPVPPRQVAPVYTPQPTIAPMQESSFPAAPPAPTRPSVADVYGGMPGTAISNAGIEVSRAPGGFIDRYNPEFDVTTVETPQGYQAGTLGKGRLSRTDQARSLLGNKQLSDKAKRTMGTMLGGLLGGAVAGPLGGILGGVVGNRMAGGGVLGGVLGYGSNYFPDRPAGGVSQWGPGMSMGELRDISPQAADAIANGGGGLY